MTEQPTTGVVPEWTIGDRLRKARNLTGLTVEDFARRTLISAKTINNYEADRVEQQPLRLEKWASVTGVSLHWLRTGEGSSVPTPPTGGGEPTPEQSDAVAKLAASKRSATRGATTGRYSRLAA